MNIEEARKEVENYLDYEGSISITAIATLYTAYEKEKEKNKELSDKLTEKICKGVEEEILEEYRQTIISKDKEIEELKDKNKFYNTAYNLGKTYANKKWKDKIKAKIEEYENKIKKIRSKKLINEPEDTIVITRYAHYISVLQSLLEKE